MYKLRPILVFVLLATAIGFSNSLVSEAATPPDPYDPEQYGVPETLGGYKVLAVLTDANYGCMGTGRRLVLQGSESTPQEALRSFQNARIKQDLEANNLAEYEGWGWEVVGPERTRGDVVSQLTKSHQFSNERGCNQPGNLTSAISAQPCPPSNYHPGFAIVQNTDAGTFTDAKAQSVYLVAPNIIGKKQTAYSAFLNNVITDANYFLQVGFFFSDGSGEFVWSATDQDCEAKQFDLNYVPGHPYWTTVSSSSTYGWWVCAADAANWSTYVCLFDGGALGTHLKLDQGTSVFVENWNPKLNWYRGFDKSFQAYGATIVRSADGISYPWTSQLPEVINCHLRSQQTKRTITGSLANDGSVFFDLSTIPRQC